MNLGEYLQNLPPNKKIRIGTRSKGLEMKSGMHSGGFVYNGRVCDFKPQELEDKYIESLVSKVTEIMMRKVMKREKARTALDNIVDQFCKIVPWYDRKIIDTYKGQYEPDATVIIVPGMESFFWYEPPVPDLTADTMDDSAARNLVDAIYKSAAEEYIYEPDHGRASALGRWIKSDPYGILDEPEAVLDACRKMRRKSK